MKRIALINARISRTPKESQKIAAEHIGISEIYLRKLEAGDETPGIKAMLKIEAYYNIPMQTLFPDIFLPNCDRKSIAN